MTVPQYTVAVDGGAAVNADWLNTYLQAGGGVVANLRSFVGVQGIVVNILGYTAANDGGQGFFYWNTGSTAPDDGGVTTVVPYGAGSGAWTRLSNLPSTVRTRLTASTTYYVNFATGSDTTGNGSSASPWQTIQYAFNYLYANIDAGGNTVTVQQSGGADTGGLVALGDLPGASTINLLLNGGINTASSYGIQVRGPARVAVSGTGSIIGANYDIVTQQGGFVSVQGVILGACTGAHLFAEQASAIVINGNYSTTGGGAYEWAVQSAGSIAVSEASQLTLSGTPAYSTAFAQALDGSINCSLATFSGTATGVRYITKDAGGIYTGTGGSATFLPGSIAGTVTAPGWYD